MKFFLKKTKKLTTHLILTSMCFLYFQANLVLVPFPTHYQQVLSITLLRNRETEQETEPELN